MSNRMTVKTSCQPLMLFIIADRMPLASKVAIVCATLASAVGDTKLALTAITGGRSAPDVSRAFAKEGGSKLSVKEAIADRRRFAKEMNARAGLGLANANATSSLDLRPAQGEPDGG
jgi:hypothetical protein